MTIEKSWPLQQAVFARLVEGLAGQGIDGAQVPVFDHVPQDPTRLHVRIDGFYMLPGRVRAGRRGLHHFTVHVFDDQTGDATGAGREHVARLQALVVAALDDWPPFSGATAIELLQTDSAADSNPATHHGVARFRSYIGD